MSHKWVCSTATEGIEQQKAMEAVREYIAWQLRVRDKGKPPEDSMLEKLTKPIQ
jgi:hypothetical protein